MKSLLFALAIVLLGVLPASAQPSDPVPSADDLVDAAVGAPIASTEVSGLDRDDLSPGLSRDIDALVDGALDPSRLDVLARRIEAEQPEFIVAVRSVALPDGAARVVFLVARISDDDDLASNINARYLVDAVEITGIPETRVSAALRADLQTLVGHRLDPDALDGLEARLEAELPGHTIRRRIARGSSADRVTVRFRIRAPEPPRWIPFAPSRSKLVYHSDLRWSGVLDILIGERDHRLTLGLVGDNDDDLVEQYSGYRIGVQSRRVGTERLGLGFEFAELRQSWDDRTLTEAALNPRVSAIYRERRSVDPTVTLALDPHLRVTGGVSINELESLFVTPATETASVGTLAVGYDRRWEPASGSHELGASYQLRATASSLGSDLDYTRQLGEVRYRWRRDRHTVIGTFQVGRVGGVAPLFERFSLGNSATLRGWSKHDVAPAGGDRMVYQSVEYRHRAIAFFLDAGSVWDAGLDASVRLSSGVGLHTEHAFVTVGFPLNASEVRAEFMAGVRF